MVWGELSSTVFDLCVYKCVCVCVHLDSVGVWIIMWWSVRLSGHDHSQPHQAIWDQAVLRHGWFPHTASVWKHWGCGRSAKWNTHQDKLAAWSHVLVVRIKMCVQCTYRGIRIFPTIERSVWAPVVCVFPPMPMGEGSGSKRGLATLKESCAEVHIFLFAFPPFLPFLSPFLPTTRAEGHGTTTGRWMRQASFPPPFFLSCSRIPFPFFS